MKDIRFRAWDSYENPPQMEYFDLFDVPLHPACEIPVMRFTGLKDKDGKEIYEGDIVRYRWSSPEEDEQGQGSVEFVEGCFIVNVSKIWTPCLVDMCRGYTTVIGNIYENSELTRG